MIIDKKILQKNKNYKNCLFLLVIVLSLLSTGLYASIKDTISTVNNLSINTVDIELSEYTKHENELINIDNTSDAKKILPAQTISLIPIIENKGIECYIRAKIDFDNNDILTEDNGEKYQLNMGNIKTINDNWKLIGDYLYYLKPLNEDEKIKLFEEIEFPSNWDNTVAKKKYGIDITIEAVQKKNFKGSNYFEDLKNYQKYQTSQSLKSVQSEDNVDFWNGLKIEKTVRSRTYLNDLNKTDENIKNTRNINSEQHRYSNQNDKNNKYEKNN